MISNAETPPELNLTGGSLRNIGSELKCCLNKKWINHILPTGTTMSMKPIQISSAPIKPREDLDHYYVVTWTLKWTRWIQISDKLTTTKLLQFPIQDQLRKFLILTDVLTEFLWRLFNQIMGRLDQNFPSINSPRFC